MDLIINIGTPEEQELIRQDLQPFVKVLDEGNLSHTYNQIILTKDMQSTVNKLEGNKNFKAMRVHGDSAVHVLAKNVPLGDKTVLVLSPLLYSNSEDQITRYFTLFHEIKHGINKNKFPPIPKGDYSLATYLFFLNWIYDEYVANRFAYAMVEEVFPEKSERWNNYIQRSFEGYIYILKDRQNYQFIQKQIVEFRKFNINANQFSDNIKQLVNDISVAIIHAYSIIHHYPELYNEMELKGLNFIDSKTIDLIVYLRTKCDNKDYELIDGIDLTSLYLTNFGFILEERETGPYYTVLDI